VRSFFGRKLVAFCSALLLSVPALAASPASKASPGKTAAPKSEPKKVASAEGLTEFDLSNGLKVVLFPDQSKPTVTVNVTYFVGSRHESYGETGMAHLLEHLMFKGTPTTSNIPAAFQEHGARWNGSTNFDRTNYFETMPASDANLEWAIRFEADRMVHSFIAKKDLDSEMTVVRNEMEAGENSPQRILYERVFATAYEWHNYGKDTIGARSDVENVPIARLQGFYRKYYQPDNAMVIVAGKFDEAKALRLINSTFGRIVPPKREIYPTYTAEPPQDGERTVTLRRVGDVQQLMAAYHVPAASHPDSAALSVLAEAMGSSPSGRLHKALVETKKAASVGAGNRHLREPGLIAFFAQVRKEDSLDNAKAALLEVVEGTKATPMTAEEVERAKNSILKNIDLMLSSSDTVGIILSESAAIGDWRLLFWDRDQLKKVSPSDVQRVASTYLKPSNRTLGMFIPTDSPDRSDVPSAPNVAQLLRQYKGDEALAAGEEFDASPASIEARTKRSQLQGGMKLALLPKKTHGEVVTAHISLNLGDEQSLTNRKTAAGVAAGMLLRGTKNKTREQIKDELDRLKARVNIFGGPTSANVIIEAKRPQLADVLKLVGEVLREPAFDAKEFELLRRERLAQVENSKSEPQALAPIELNRHLKPRPKGHPQYTETIDETIAGLKAVTLEEVKSFYRDFYGASFSQMAVVGDFDAPEVSALVSSMFSSWKTPKPFVRIVNKYIDVAGKNTALETPDKANAVFFAGMNLNVRDDDVDYPALVLANYLLGGAQLNSRLATRLRQKEGLSYGTFSSLNVSALDKEGTFTNFAIYAPENVSRLEKAWQEEIERAVKEGFGAEEVSKGKSGLLQQRQLSRAQDNSLAGTLTSYLFLDRTLKWDSDLEQKISALSPEQVTAAFRRYVDPKKITIVKAGNFAKNKSTEIARQPAN